MCRTWRKNCPRWVIPLVEKPALADKGMPPPALEYTSKEVSAVCGGVLC